MWKFLIKILGSSHQMVKHNDLAMKSPTFKSVTELLEDFITSERLEQGVSELKQINYLAPLLSDFPLKLSEWMTKDIKKEAKLEIEKSNLPLDTLEQQISEKIKKWWNHEKLKETEESLKNLVISPPKDVKPKNYSEKKIKEDNKEKIKSEKNTQKNQTKSIPTNRFTMLDALLEDDQ